MPYLVAFWNLENLFAPEGHPERLPWLEKEVGDELKGWTRALFDRKLAQLATVIAAMKGGQGPDLLGVCEVENRFVLEELCKVLHQRLPARRYAPVHVDSERDQRGIDTAFIVDTKVLKPPPKKLLFSHWVMRRTGTRDITQATFTTTAGRELIVLANHWPSRSGGELESAPYRMTAGETLGYWHERICEEKNDPNVAVIAMGDFNDDPFDPSLRVHARAWREREAVLAATLPAFLNLSWNYLRTDGVSDHKGGTRTLHGTLYFGGKGNLFDQILVSRGLAVQGQPLGVDAASARVETFAGMVDHRSAQGPRRFGLPKGNAARNVDVTGFSDHFPVSVLVQES